MLRRTSCECLRNAWARLVFQHGFSQDLRMWIRNVHVFFVSQKAHKLAQCFSSSNLSEEFPKFFGRKYETNTAQLGDGFETA